MAAFCRFWRMTPAEVEALDGPMWAAMVRFQNREVRAANRAAKKGRRG